MWKAGLYLQWCGSKGRYQPKNVLKVSKLIWEISWFVEIIELKKMISWQSLNDSRLVENIRRIRNVVHIYWNIFSYKQLWSPLPENVLPKHFLQKGLLKFLAFTKKLLCPYRRNVVLSITRFDNVLIVGHHCKTCS